MGVEMSVIKNKKNFLLNNAFYDIIKNRKEVVLNE